MTIGIAPMESLYDNTFYAKRHARTLHAAQTILTLVQEHLPPISSAVDIGCGVGTWLSVLKDRGTADVLGIDGPWVNKQDLHIPADCFVERDLTRPFDVNRTFDLAISLEVAEHLAPGRAAGFVSGLTQLADFILFSAAVPFQGGIGHVNEQWPSYWMSLFRERGFIALDVVRRRTWTDDSIPIWYRQNVLLFVRKNRVSDLKLTGSLADVTPPEEYLLYFNRLLFPGIKQSFIALLDAIRRRLTRTYLHRADRRC